MVISLFSAHHKDTAGMEATTPGLLKMAPGMNEATPSGFHGGQRGKISP